MDGHNSTILIGRSVVHVREDCLKSFHALHTVGFEAHSDLREIDRKNTATRYANCEDEISLLLDTQSDFEIKDDE
jgi:hypothetical protein